MRAAVIVGSGLLVALCACESTPTSPRVDPNVSEKARAAASVERIAHACAKIASCAHAHDTPRDRDPSACVDWWIAHVRGEGDPFAKCIGSASTCEGIDACGRDRGDPIATAYCGAHPDAQTACSGAHLIACGEDDPGESSSVDCAAIGAICGEHQLSGGLVARGCLSPKMCPPGAPEARCDGPGAIVSCNEGAVQRTACPRGIPCQEHKTSGDQSATCEPPGHVHCHQIGQERCDGTRLVQCVPHGPFGEPRVIDCAAYGLECAGAQGKASCTVPGSKACEAGGVRCEGEAVGFCAAGRRVTVSCAALGFGPCDPDGRGLDAGCHVASHTR